MSERPISGISTGAGAARRRAPSSSAAPASLDPRAGIDGVHDVVVRDGADRRARAPGEAPRPTTPRSSTPRGCTLLPAFFDPHVHLRTPGREDEEDIETGTRAAAAGGYCGDPRDGEHRAAGRHARRRSLALRERAGADASGAGRLPRHRHPRHGGRGADRDGRASRRRGRRLLRRRPADAQRPRDAPRAPVPAARRPSDRAPRGGPRALRRGRDARGRGLGGARAWPASPRSPSRR